MRLQKIEDFEVWKKAEDFTDAVTAILDRPVVARNCKLVEEIRSALDSIEANLSEGFEQPTDRAFVRFLYTSKGSTAEVCTRLRRVRRMNGMTKPELEQIRRRGDEVARMLNGLIKHLMKTPDRRRGLGRTSDQRPETNDD